MTVERKTTTLYNGEVEVVFTPGNHTYKVNGEKPVSVTTALGIIDKPALVRWAVKLMKTYLLTLKNEDGHGHISEEDIIVASNLHLDRKRDAGATGTLVHEWAEAYIKGLNPPMPTDPRVQYGVIAFLNWVKEYDIRFVASEKIVYSRKHNYVGIMDDSFTMGREDHKIIHAGDFKTGGAIYDEYRFQVAAYEEADTEESGIVYGDKWIIRFAKEDKYDEKTGELIERAGTFEAVCIPSSEHAADFAAFLAAKTIYLRKAELKAMKE